MEIDGGEDSIVATSLLDASNLILIFPVHAKHISAYVQLPVQ
jgi:hypothetical protein